MPVCRIRS